MLAGRMERDNAVGLCCWYWYWYCCFCSQAAVMSTVPSSPSRSQTSAAVAAVAAVAAWAAAPKRSLCTREGSVWEREEEAGTSGAKRAVGAPRLAEEERE